MEEIKTGWAITVTYEREEGDPILDYACDLVTIWDVYVDINSAKNYKREVEEGIFENASKIACDKYSTTLQCEQVGVLKLQYNFMNSLLSNIKVELIKVNIII